MSSRFTHGDKFLKLSNLHFTNLVNWSVDVGRATALDKTEYVEVERIAALEAEGALWPGRGFDLDEDFPDAAQRKFWARVYPDIARGIYLREIGDHNRTYWQAQYIWAAYEVGRLFRDAVDEPGRRFVPATLDNELFDKEINRIPPTRPELQGKGLKT